MKDAIAKIILVHGTWGRGFNPDKDARRKTAGNPADLRWFEAGSRLCAALSSGLSGLVQATDLSAFLWSGANSIEERQSAATRLAKTLDESVVAAPEAKHFIIAHSHGGNVALDARQAMSRDAVNVHIITMATPFLSIYEIAPRLTDRLFAIYLSIGLAVLAIYVIWAIGPSLGHGFTALFLAICLISLLSILFGATTLFSRAYQLIRKRRPSNRSRSQAVNLAKRVNNRSLLAGGLLFCVGWLSFGFAITTALLPLVLPALLVLFLSIPTADRVLYCARYMAPNIRQNIPNLAILRSRRDEASLALFFGKITSVLSHVAASISIIVPIAVAALAALFLFYVIKTSVEEFRHYQDCVARGEDCFIPGEYFIALLIDAMDLGGKAARYLAFGFGICVAFVVLAAVGKSLFGRELLYRSLNATVDVYDTPDGSKSYRINWCTPVQENAFGLRHSLYNNPDAVNKIVAHINNVCAGGATRDVPAAPAQASEAGRNRIWRMAAAIGVVSGTYAIAVLWTYAPPGAASSWCALSSYFEPSGLKGDFTILVARFDGDFDGIGDGLAAEVSRRYGLHVIRTCLHVTANSDDSSSAKRLLSSYSSDLVLWGKVAKGGQIELQVRQRDRDPNEAMPIMVAQDAMPEFVAKHLQSYVIKSIEDSSLEISSSDPAANVADYADRADAFVQSIDWSDNPSADVLEKFDRLRDKIGMYAAAGRLMLAAALASHDGPRVKNGIAYFVLASSAFDSSGEYKSMITDYWEDAFSLALLSDARLNKDEESAKLAASRYLKRYQDSVENLTGGSNYELYQRAGVAASAYTELHSITQSQDAARSAIRLACESVLRLRYYQEDREAAERRAAPLAKQGLSQGILPKAPPPEQTDGYKILVRFGKDPSSIFAPGPEMKLKDCETF